MSTAKVIGWKALCLMLHACARGWTFEDKKHRRWIRWNEATSTTIPLGEHGKRKNANYDIPVGKVKNLVWTLGIDHRCAERLLGIPIPERP